MRIPASIDKVIAMSFRESEARNIPRRDSLTPQKQRRERREIFAVAGAGVPEYFDGIFESARGMPARHSERIFKVILKISGHPLKRDARIRRRMKRGAMPR